MSIDYKCDETVRLRYAEPCKPLYGVMTGVLKTSIELLERILITQNNLLGGLLYYKLQKRG